jgi:hypothetical protein
VAELVNQTGHGLLKFSGMHGLGGGAELRMQRRALNKPFSRSAISITKCLWKLIASNNSSHNNNHNNSPLGSNSVHAMIEAVYSSPSTKYGTSHHHYHNQNHFSNNQQDHLLSACYLILNDDVLYIVDKGEDMLLRAFYIGEIDIQMTRGGSCSYVPVPPLSSETTDSSGLTEAASSLLCISLNNQPRVHTVDPGRLLLNQQQSIIDGRNNNNNNNSLDYEQNYVNTMDRLVDYVLHLNPPTKASVTVTSSSSADAALVCVCGARIVSLKSINKVTVAESLNEAMKVVSISSLADVNGSQTADSNNMRQHTTHMRQGSNYSDVAKIHRSVSANTATQQQQQLPISGYETGQLENGSQSNGNVLASAAVTSGAAAASVHASSKKFFYYVDPRLSANFINIFNSLKRRVSNKGFSF